MAIILSLFSISIVTGAAKSSLMMPLMISSRFSTDTSCAELLVSAASSSSFRSYCKSAGTEADWMVSVLRSGSISMPWLAKHSCHFSLVK